MGQPLMGRRTHLEDEGDEDVEDDEDLEEVEHEEEEPRPLARHRHEPRDQVRR
jgi:hypothetical protein